MLDTNLTSQLSELEHALLDSSTRADSHRVAALLDDDFIEFGSSGRIWNKRAVIEGLAAEAARTQKDLTVSELSVKQLADSVALVTYAIGRGTGGRQGSLRSSVWKLEDGAWRMVFHQGTPVPAEVIE